MDCCMMSFDKAITYAIEDENKSSCHEQYMDVPSGKIYVLQHSIACPGGAPQGVESIKIQS